MLCLHPSHSNAFFYAFDAPVSSTTTTGCTHNSEVIQACCLQVDELNDKLKDLEDTCAPIISKMYQEGGGEGGMSGSGTPGGGMPDGSGTTSGPTVEEVD